MTFTCNHTPALISISSKGDQNKTLDPVFTDIKNMSGEERSLLTSNDDTRYGANPNSGVPHQQQQIDNVEAEVPVIVEHRLRRFRRILLSGTYVSSYHFDY